VGRILHINDERRISAYQHLLNPEYLIDKSINSKELVKFKRMLSVSLLSQVINKEKELDSPDKGWQKILEHPQVCDELTQLLDVLLEQTDHLNHSIDQIPDCPLQVHGSYTRLEILAATMQGKQNEISVKQWREGCLWAKDEKADLLAFTLDKTDGAFSPTTRYKDYAISRELMHWESQSTTADTSETGNRYQRHATLGTSILLFARRQTSDRDFLFLGPATYVSHLSSRPMGITWRLAHPLPGDVYAEFAAAVA